MGPSFASVCPSEQLSLPGTVTRALPSRMDPVKWPRTEFSPGYFFTVFYLNPGSLLVSAIWAQNRSGLPG